MNTGNLSVTHAFDYIVFRIKPSLTSCEDLATALIDTEGKEGAYNSVKYQISALA